MGIRICPKCNGKVSTSRNVCIHCGYVFPSSKKCPDCGEPVDVDTLECPVCGYLFNKESITKKTLIEEKEISNDEQREVTVSKPETVIVPIEVNDIQTEKIDDEEHVEVSDDAQEDIDDQVEVDDDLGVTAHIEDEQNPESSVECPYCGSKSLMSIGTGLYMCNTCRGKFLNLVNDESEEHPTNVSESSDSIDIKISDEKFPVSEGAAEEVKTDTIAQPEKCTNVNEETISEAHQTTKETKINHNGSKTIKQGTKIMAIARIFSLKRK